MYDTLLQMGRWFGYRPDYEDLCRLYTTPALRNAYVEITAANDELRREFDEMAAVDAKPEDFGLRVRTSPAGLEITARNKMRLGTKVKVSYSGDMPETVTFDMRETTLAANFQLLERFAARLDGVVPVKTDDATGSLVWAGVPADEITDGFLDDYLAGKAPRVRPKFIADYIRKCELLGELSNWTVRIVSNSNKAVGTVKIGSHDIGLIKRSALGEADDPERYRIRRIISPSDEGKDLIVGSDQWQRALEAAQHAAKNSVGRNGQPRKTPALPDGPALRHARRSDQAHLLIYPAGEPDAGQHPGCPAGCGFRDQLPVLRACEGHCSRVRRE